jgi:hypothetical protein
MGIKMNILAKLALFSAAIFGKTYAQTVDLSAVSAEAPATEKAAVDPALAGSAPVAAAPVAAAPVAAAPVAPEVVVAPVAGVENSNAAAPELKTLSPKKQAEKEEKLAKQKAKWDAMTPEQQAKIIAKRQAKKGEVHQDPSLMQLPPQDNLAMAVQAGVHNDPAMMMQEPVTPDELAMMEEQPMVQADPAMMMQQPMVQVDPAMMMQQQPVAGPQMMVPQDQVAMVEAPQA